MESVQPIPNENWIKTIEELRTYEKKNLRINRIRLFCAAVSVVLCIVIAVMLSVNIDRITEDINEVSAAITETGENINIVAMDLQKIDFSEIVASAQTFTETGTETINQIKDATKGLDSILDEADSALKNISNINIKQLNESIQELHDVLEPLAKFFNIFH